MTLAFVAGAPLNSTVDSLGNLYVAKAGTTKLWKMTRAGAWSELSPNFGSSGNQINAAAVDPANPNRIFAIGSGGCVSRSLDGGATWAALGNFYKFANTLSWLPQTVSGSASRWRSNGGILFDSTGRLWSPQGNEGVLTTVPSTTNTETNTNPLLWTIDSKGIEEFVTHDVVLLPGSGDAAVTAVEDATAFRLENPETFTAVQANLQDQLISNATGLAVCPNDSNYVAVVTADVNNTGSGKDYSGYSTDGGKTWTSFATHPAGAKAGSIAISKREGWGVGSDHLVWYRLSNRPPYWSADGGATWTLATGFPLNTDGTFVNASGYWNFSLKQRALIADPHTADRFYINLTTGGLYRSDDGGRSWVRLPGTNLPTAGHHAQLVANPYVAGELWFADGWEGAASHGLWRSVDGLTFSKIPGIDNAITLAVGKGSGATGAIYFYGKCTGDPDWGIFRSLDNGATWDRISRYPAGLLDIPTCMAASQDTFGLVWVGFSGNSYFYGRPAGSANLLLNRGFEAALGSTGWKSWWDTSMSTNPFFRDTAGGAPGGNYHGTISSAAAQYDVNVYQNLTGLQAGTYTLRGLFKTGGTHTLLRFGAYGFDAAGSVRWTNITNSDGLYRQFTVSGIPVSNGKITLSIQAKSKTGGWVHFDQFELIRD